jgi:hypothetical protein
MPSMNIREYDVVSDFPDVSKLLLLKGLYGVPSYSFAIASTLPRSEKVSSAI